MGRERGQSEGEGEWKGRKVAGREGWEQKVKDSEREPEGDGRWKGKEKRM